MDTMEDLAEQFRKKLGTYSAVYRAPGRVNLIGEHTDYNDGFVLPACVEFSCWVAIGPRDDDKFVIYSENFSETIESSLGDGELRPSHRWSDYPLGVAWALQQSGYRLRGANLYIRGNIPLGAGLSSSAALEVSVGCAILDLLGQKIDRTQLALLCQRAENEFVGARCGIMDQFSAATDKQGTLCCSIAARSNIDLYQFRRKLSWSFAIRWLSTITALENIMYDALSAKRV